MRIFFSLQPKSVPESYNSLMLLHFATFCHILPWQRAAYLSASVTGSRAFEQELIQWDVQALENRKKPQAKNCT
jgi:hypothetical protein